MDGFNLVPRRLIEHPFRYASLIPPSVNQICVVPDWAVAVQCGRTQSNHNDVFPLQIWIDQLNTHTDTYTHPETATTSGHASLPLHHAFVPSVLLDPSEFLGCESEVTGMKVMTEKEIILVSFKAGHLYSVDMNTGDVELIGHVETGIDAIGLSPDSEIVVLVSLMPENDSLLQMKAKVILMTSEWDPVGESVVEFPSSSREDTCRGDPSVSLSWRGDGNFFVLDIHGDSAWVFTRQGQPGCKLNFEDPNEEDKDLRFGAICAWQPRVGGLVAISSVNSTKIRFFEKNGLRHLRNDFHIRRATLYKSCKVEIKHMEFSPDSALLAVCVRFESQDPAIHVTQLHIYYRGNYYWYLKHARDIQDEQEIIYMKWHEENPRSLILGSAQGHLALLDFRWDPAVLSPQIDPKYCTACVVDGEKIKFTPFKKAMVPPPMSMHEKKLQGLVESLILPQSLDPTPEFGRGDGLAVVLSDGQIHSLKSDPVIMLAGKAGNHGMLLKNVAREYIFISSQVACIIPTATHDTLILSSGSWDTAVSLKINGRVERVIPSASNLNHLWVFSSHGKTSLLQLCSYDNSIWNVETVVDASILALDVFTIDNVLCWSSKQSTDQLAVHLSNGRLLLFDLAKEKFVLLFSECTSLSRSDEYLLFITRAHVVVCIHLHSRQEHGHDHGSRSQSMGSQRARGDIQQVEQKIHEIQLTKHKIFNISIQEVLDTWESANSTIVAALQQPLTKNGLARTAVAKQRSILDLVETRPIERGSLLVAALCHDVRVVLAAPRGNYETIVPRPMVISRVISLVRDEKDYAEAFKLCRAQRLEADLLVNASEDFMEEADLLISQVNDPSKINIFVTLYAESARKANLMKKLQDDSSHVKYVASVLNRLVQSMDKQQQQSHQQEQEQQQPDSSAEEAKYLFPIITCLILQNPPDFEQVLRRIQALTSADLMESAIDYLIVLCNDSERVYKEALGTYDLRLAAMVASQSQLDPHEYREQLATLQQMPEYRRKFEIDSYLKRYKQALESLFVSENPEDRATCLRFALHHQLFVQALHLFRSDVESSATLRKSYADYLYKQKDYFTCGSVLMQNNEHESAALVYRNGLYYQLAIQAAWHVKLWNTAAIPLSEISSTSNITSLQDFIRSVSDRLSEHGMNLEAARVRLLYMNDVSGALQAFVEHEYWMEAIHACSYGYQLAASRHNMESSILLPALMHAVESKMDVLLSSASKVNERGKRLVHLRETQALMSDRMKRNGVGANGVDDSNSDVFSDTTAASSIGSNFTFVSHTSVVSSVASSGLGSTVSFARREKHHARKIHKQSRKKIRQGHPKEEEYLVEYLKNFIPKVKMIQSMDELIKALTYYGKYEQVHGLRGAWNRLVEEITNLPDDVLAVAASEMQFSRKMVIPRKEDVEEELGGNIAIPPPDPNAEAVRYVLDTIRSVFGKPEYANLPLC